MYYIFSPYFPSIPIIEDSIDPVVKKWILDSLEISLKEKLGPDMTDSLLGENQDLKGWGPEGNDRGPYKTREAEIGQGGLGSRPA